MHGYMDGMGTKEAQMQVAVTNIPLTVEFMRQLFVFLIRYTIYSNYHDKPYLVAANSVVIQNL
jgi:hypothetical protein